MQKVHDENVKILNKVSEFIFYGFCSTHLKFSCLKQYTFIILSYSFLYHESDVYLTGLKIRYQ